MHVYVCALIIASFQWLLKYRLYTHVCLERDVSFPHGEEDGKVEPTWLQPFQHFCYKSAIHEMSGSQNFVTSTYP